MITRERKELTGRQPLVTPVSSGGGCLIIFGIPFLAIGTFVTLISLGVIAVKSSKNNAPPFVLSAVGLVFALAGLAVMWSGFKSMREYARIKNAKALNPDRPWDADYAWEREGCRVRKGREASGSFVAFLGLGLFLVPFNWWAFFSNQSNCMVIGIVGVFDVVLMAILCHGIYTLLQAAKYGDPFLRFEKFPYHTGEKFTATFEPSQPLGSFRSVEIVLRCIHVDKVEVRSSKGGKHMEYRCIQIYAEELKIEEAGTMGTEALPLAFDIPINVPGTSLLDEPVRFWELTIKADTPGIDFDATFPLPIYSKPRA